MIEYVIMPVYQLRYTKRLVSLPNPNYSKKKLHTKVDHFSMKIRTYRGFQAAIYTVFDAESDGDDENDGGEAPEEKILLLKFRKTIKMIFIFLFSSF